MKMITSIPINKSFNGQIVLINSRPSLISHRLSDRDSIYLQFLKDLISKIIKI